MESVMNEQAFIAKLESEGYVFKGWIKGPDGKMHREYVRKEEPKKIEKKDNLEMAFEIKERSFFSCDDLGQW